MNKKNGNIKQTLNICCTLLPTDDFLAKSHHETIENPLPPRPLDPLKFSSGPNFDHDFGSGSRSQNNSGSTSSGSATLLKIKGVPLVEA